MSSKMDFFSVNKSLCSQSQASRLASITACYSANKFLVSVLMNRIMSC